MTIMKVIRGQHSIRERGNRFLGVVVGLQVKLSFCINKNGNIRYTVVERKIWERKQCFYGVAAYERNLG